MMSSLLEWNCLCGSLPGMLSHRACVSEDQSPFLSAKLVSFNIFSLYGELHFNRWCGGGVGCPRISGSFWFILGSGIGSDISTDWVRRAVAVVEGTTLA